MQYNNKQYNNLIIHTDNNKLTLNEVIKGAALADLRTSIKNINTVLSTEDVEALPQEDKNKLTIILDSIEKMLNMIEGMSEHEEVTYTEYVESLEQLVFVHQALIEYRTAVYLTNDIINIINALFVMYPLFLLAGQLNLLEQGD